MPAYGYEFYLLVVNSISHSFAALTPEISSWPLEDKIHIHARACNILYVIYYIRPLFFSVLNTWLQKKWRAQNMTVFLSSQLVFVLNDCSLALSESYISLVYYIRPLFFSNNFCKQLKKTYAIYYIEPFFYNNFCINSEDKGMVVVVLKPGNKVMNKCNFLNSWKRKDSVIVESMPNMFATFHFIDGWCRVRPAYVNFGLELHPRRIGK